MNEYSIRFTCESKEECTWVWESLKGKKINGITVTAMSNGDIFERCSAYEEMADIYLQNSMSLSDEDDVSISDLESKINESWN